MHTLIRFIEHDYEYQIASHVTEYISIRAKETTALKLEILNYSGDIYKWIIRLANAVKSVVNYMYMFVSDNILLKKWENGALEQ